jgi:hypothetical protein
LSLLGILPTYVGLLLAIVRSAYSLSDVDRGPTSH